MGIQGAPASDILLKKPPVVTSDFVNSLMNLFMRFFFCTPDMGDNLAVKVCSAESNKRNRSGSQRQGKYREVLTEGSRI